MKSSIPPARRERRGLWWIGRAEVEAAEWILEALWPDPDRLLDQAREIPSPWKNRATDKGVVRVRGRDYFLKRYNCPDWGYRVKNLFRKSRGEKSWDAARDFLRLGIPTPLPLVWMEERPWRLLGRSYLAFPHVQGGGSLLEVWPGLEAAVRMEILEGAAVVIGRMHAEGFLHGDLNWRNLLVREGGEGPQVLLVDLDGCRRVGSPSLEKAEKDLGHFLRDLGRTGAERGVQERFLARWEWEFLSG